MTSATAETVATEVAVASAVTEAIARAASVPSRRALKALWRPRLKKARTSNSSNNSSKRHGSTPMRAIAIREFGAPEVLVEVERPDPQPGAGELLIRVTASGVNRPDVFQRKGAYAPPPGVGPA